MSDGRRSEAKAENFHLRRGEGAVQTGKEAAKRRSGDNGAAMAACEQAAATCPRF